MILHEQWRPKALSEVVGQDEACRQIETLRPRGLGGRGYWLAGPSGTGKTSLGYLIAQELAGELGTEEVDAATLTPKDILDWRRGCSRRCLGERPITEYVDLVRREKCNLRACLQKIEAGEFLKNRKAA